MTELCTNCGVNMEQEDVVYDYTLSEMPNCTPMIGDVAMLTHKVSKLLDDTNEGFMAAEKLIREHVWKEARKAYNDAR